VQQRLAGAVEDEQNCSSAYMASATPSPRKSKAVPAAMPLCPDRGLPEDLRPSAS
jgi:hypothetical protein